MSSSMPTISTPPTPTPQLPTAKLTAIARFKSFTGTLARSRSKRSKIEFPPPSWDIEDFQPSSTGQEPAQYPSSQPAASENIVQESTSTNTAEEPVEPVTFARRLQVLLESLPRMPNQATTPPADGGGAEPRKGEPSSTPPVPPDLDPKLVKMLSSEDVMNGDSGASGKGATHPSIWNILAGLRRDDKGDTRGERIASSVEEAEGGLMMYAPLEPKADSEVCLAESETVIEPPHPPTPGGSTPAPEPEEKRIWVPSTTELSLLTTWWGYRLYLPPPVMQKLGASSVKAATRAAMVTSALKWLVDKIPTLLVPPPLRPALKMLKTLVPLAGYVGVFVAWSWDRIRAIDEGNGVVLSATWLLPVALLPMAWDAGVIFRPMLAPTPEELLEAEKARKAEEEAEKARKAKEEAKDKDERDGSDKDKKKNKSKLRFW